MPEAGPQHEIVKRIASALVLAFVALGAVAASPWTFVILVVAAGAIISWEWGRLVRGASFDLISVITTLAVTAVAVLAALGRDDAAIGVTVLALGAVAVFSFG